MKYTRMLIAVFLLCFAHTAFSQQNAEEIIEKAREQARIENKNVLVFFHASWCSWCKQMEKKMNSDSTKDLFEKNYVFASLNVQERGDKKKLQNPNGEEFLSKYGGEKAGLPFFAFINQEGEVLETSMDGNNENIGCPSTEREVDFFIAKLKKTSELNDEQLKMIAKIFLEK